MNPFELSFLQFATCSLLSLLVSLFFEDIYLKNILNTSIPILYAGILSVGVAYTLQVVGQQKSHPSHASIILSLEGVFAVLGGAVVLGEILSLREISGCVLMLAGMITSQISYVRPEH